jgi:type II restriction/modification system DNA methylase subunit YeeA
MNTNQLKRFAQSARTKLISQVAARLDFVLHTDSAELREKTESLRRLQEVLNADGREQVVERVAYTWFNRFVALRFMDVNDYQPLGIRVVTPKEGYTLPELLEEAKHGLIADELPVHRNEVMELLDGLKPSANPQNEAYKLLLTAACNHLNSIFPFLFERINDYTELLMPDDLISQYSILYELREGMEAADCREVEIIGWLYQFYISEKKDAVFASKSSVKKEDIPAATQLFTPRWIVEYMVQNTVGKLWLQNRPNSKIRQFMPYYIESATSQSADFLPLKSIEELRLLDQACGSGHILVYGFELLYRIYEEEGYNPSDIPKLIIENNLYGFEIDERAAQLSGFALMMKARGYHRRFFRKEVKPNILCYTDLKLSADATRELFAQLSLAYPESLQTDLEHMRQATNLGSLIQPLTSLVSLLELRETLKNKAKTADLFTKPALMAVQEVVEQLIPLAGKYHCVVDNPPYMGGGNMNKELGDYVKKHYPDSKADLMTCFMQRAYNQVIYNGYVSMINLPSWMFLSSFEDFRKDLLKNNIIKSLLHLGRGIFGSDFGSVSFVIQRSNDIDSKGIYRRLFKEHVKVRSINDIAQLFLNRNKDKFIVSQNNFGKIPGSPIGYWISQNLIDSFVKGKPIKQIAPPKQGLATGDNEQFLRNWNEIIFKDFNHKWRPINKGGEFRKWYGNNQYVVNWENDGYKLKNFKNAKGKLRSRPQNQSFYFKKGFTWSTLSIGSVSFRYSDEKFLFETKGSKLFPINDDDFYKIIGFLNSKIVNELLLVLSPTVDFHEGPIGNLPYISNELLSEEIPKLNIGISKSDWDSRETSWDFQQNELIRCKSNCGQNCADLDMLDEEDQKEILAMANVPTNSNLLEDCYQAYTSEWRRKFFQLHQNEEELNRQFIEIYGLQDELTPDVPLEDITILKEETTIENGELVFHADEVMAQFVSYAVGCMFGRYSLDKEGLILANQGETLSDYVLKVNGERLMVDGEGIEDDNHQPFNENHPPTFLPDADNIIPVLDEEWFEDDIVSRFNEFLKASFGKENFEKNLAFVEESLGMDMRKYFTKNFYTDHVRRYKKRPIYWMFSSPRGSFNVLIYMHRYTRDTLNQVLNGYLREYKEKISAHMEHLDHIIETGTSVEATRATKQRDKYRIVLLELQDYERDILYPLATQRIAIDLDDGVLVNYNKFGKAIKEVAGLNDKKTKEKVKGFDWIDGEEVR